MSPSIDKPRTLDAAHGRWREILPQLGVSPKVLDGKHHPCPACGGEDRFRFHDRQKDGDHYCNGCGAGKGVSLVMKVNGWTYGEAAKRVDEIIGNLPKDAPARKEPPPYDTRAEATKLWNSGKAITSTDPAGRFLRSRGITIFSNELRFVRDMFSSELGADLPGMVARVCDVAGRGRQLHRTYLGWDGKKASLKVARRMLKGDFPKGGAIRLFAPEEKIGVAEGIETALAATMLYDMPVWSVLSERIMQDFEPPEEVKHLVIFGDNDLNHVGQHAAYALARRLSLADGYRERGLKVSVVIPDRPGDWNDVLMSEVGYARAA